MVNLSINFCDYLQVSRTSHSNSRSSMITSSWNKYVKSNDCMRAERPLIQLWWKTNAPFPSPGHNHKLCICFISSSKLAPESCTVASLSPSCWRHKQNTHWTICLPWGGPGQRFHPERWEVTLKNVSEHHFYRFLKELWILRLGCSLKSPTHMLSIRTELGNRCTWIAFTLKSKHPSRREKVLRLSM